MRFQLKYPSLINSSNCRLTHLIFHAITPIQRNNINSHLILGDSYYGLLHVSHILLKICIIFFSITWNNSAPEKAGVPFFWYLTSSHQTEMEFKNAFYFDVNTFSHSYTNRKHQVQHRLQMWGTPYLETTDHPIFATPHTGFQPYAVAMKRC